MKTSHTKLFVVIFSGEVMGYLNGRSLKGTAKRYGTWSGIDPNDADLELVDVTSGISQKLQILADKAGTIQILK